MGESNSSCVFTTIVLIALAFTLVEAKSEYEISNFIVRVYVMKSPAYCWGMLLSHTWVLTESMRTCFNMTDTDGINPTHLVVAHKKTIRHIVNMKRNYIDKDAYLDGYPELFLLQMGNPLYVSPIHLNTFPIGKVCQVVMHKRQALVTVEIHPFSFCQTEYNVVTWEGERCYEVSKEDRPARGMPLLCGKALSAIKTESSTIQTLGGKWVDVILPLQRFIPWMADYVDDLPPTVSRDGGEIKSSEENLSIRVLYNPNTLLVFLILPTIDIF